MKPKPEKFQHLVELALKEDIGRKDITTEAVIGDIKVKAVILSKDEGIIAGLQITKAVFQHVSKNTKFKKLAKDGDKVYKNQIIAQLEGKAKNILIAERTALNFLSHLSGIATLTSKYVEKVKPYGCRILDTRKTTPVLRELEKYAVRVGGGYNHRKGLYDMVLIKDNHLKLRASDFKIKKLVDSVRKKTPKGIKIEVEVNTIEELKRVHNCRVDIIMLDNMSLANIKKAVDWVKLKNSKAKTKKTILEASGGIDLSNVREVAKTGVDWISIGEITHSAPAFDTSLEIIPEKINGTAA
jgi:nicotinate-nucleotide pyrophosphorylase (carboxylating)